MNVDISSYSVIIWSLLIYFSQFCALLWTFISAVVYVAVYLPFIVLKLITPTKRSSEDPKRCKYYEGFVDHRRKLPVENSFRYPVRVVVVNLDLPPEWWKKCAADHLTATEARRLAATNGPVWLLTNPVTAGYTQNPISVYYCYARSGELVKCIAEVTNTPWGERVKFLFTPDGQLVPKSLHVSPFMDMKGSWFLRATEPKDTLLLIVKVTHPDMGDFFFAALEAKRSRVNLASEAASLGMLLQYGFQPHRVALWIYWQAVKLLWKGVPVFMKPDTSCRQAIESAATNPRCPDGAHFKWEPAKQFPWNADS